MSIDLKAKLLSLYCGIINTAAGVVVGTKVAEVTNNVHVGVTAGIATFGGMTAVEMAMIEKVAEMDRKAEEKSA